MSQEIKIGLSISVKVFPAILMGTKRNYFENTTRGPKILNVWGQPLNGGKYFWTFLLASELGQAVQNGMMYQA